jgi:hypothetical protein
MPMVSTGLYPKFYNRRSYTNNEYIYMYKHYDSFWQPDDIDKRCVYGFIVDKNDPFQRAKSWKIFKGKEFCKQARGIIF